MNKTAYELGYIASITKLAQYDNFNRMYLGPKGEIEQDDYNSIFQRYPASTAYKAGKVAPLLGVGIGALAGHGIAKSFSHNNLLGAGIGAATGGLLGSGISTITNRSEQQNIGRRKAALQDLAKKRNINVNPKNLENAAALPL